MALTAMPGYKASSKAGRAAQVRGVLGLMAPSPKSVVPKKPVVAPVTGAGASLLGPSAGPNIPTSLPTVKTDYQAQIGKLLTGLGVGNLSGYVPPSEYQGEITADPEYQLGQTNLTNTQNTLAQGRANAFRQAFIAGGFAPGTFQSALGRDPNLAQFAGDIDQGTIDAAAANQMSGQAQRGRQLAEAQAALPYQLAARGVARSGAAATRSSAFQRSYDEQSATGLSSLLDALRGTTGDYNTGLQNAANQWEQTKSGIANRLAQTRGYSQPTPDWDLESILAGLGGPEGPVQPREGGYSDDYLRKVVSAPVANYAASRGQSPYKIVGGPTMGFKAPAARAPAAKPKAPAKAPAKKKGK